MGKLKSGVRIRFGALEKLERIKDEKNILSSWSLEDKKKMT